MACPFFEPTTRLDESSPRLPLGDACDGLCHATPVPLAPDPATLRSYCNRGYARYGCARFPPGSPDALRFSLATDHEGVLMIHYIYERDYAPERHGQVQFPGGDLDDPIARAQLRFFAESYLRRRVAR